MEWMKTMNSSVTSIFHQFTMKYHISNLKIILTTENTSLVTEMIHIGYCYGKNFP